MKWRDMPSYLPHKRVNREHWLLRHHSKHWALVPMRERAGSACIEKLDIPEANRESSLLKVSSMCSYGRLWQRCVLSDISVLPVPHQAGTRMGFKLRENRQRPDNTQASPACPCEAPKKLREGFRKRRKHLQSCQEEESWVPTSLLHQLGSESQAQHPFLGALWWS